MYLYPDAVDGIAWHTADTDAWARYAAGRYASAVERGEAEAEEDGT